jgi:hypothetical protein
MAHTSVDFRSLLLAEVVPILRTTRQALLDGDDVSTVGTQSFIVLSRRLLTYLAFNPTRVLELPFLAR